MFMVHGRNFNLLTTVNYSNIAPSLFGTIKNITPFLYGTYILLDTHTHTHIYVQRNRKYTW